jgi:hypothetical protein
MRRSRLHSAWLATSLVLSSIDGAVGEAESASVKTDGRPDGAEIGVLKASRLSAESTIGDLLNDPAFAGYATLLMPWDDRAYDETMRLREFGAQLPYHSHVDPGSTVTGLNRIADDVADGKPVAVMNALALTLTAIFILPANRSLGGGKSLDAAVVAPE